MKHSVLSVIAIILTVLVLVWFWNVITLLGASMPARAAVIATQPVPVEEMKVTVYKPIYLMDATVSAYTDSVEENDSRPWETADGSDLRNLKANGVGIVACPARFPFDSKVQWNGKWWRCADRMNTRYRDLDVFDVLVSDKKTAFEIGRRRHEIVTVWVKI